MSIYKKLYDPREFKQQDLLMKQLESDSPSLFAPIPEPLHIPNMQVSTDSGAHTLYKSIFVQGSATEYARKNADYSFIKTDQFKKFLDDYIKNLLENKDDYTFYVTLDIINNPQASWEITEYIESYGLNPIPVFHNGEDISWFKKMIEKYEYIGISGLGQDITKTKFKHFGDSCFKLICDSNGTPRNKIHGFAMGTPEILAQYPWYSADQSTWTYMSRVGTLLIPRPIIKNKQIIGFDYESAYYGLPITARRRFERSHRHHIQAGIRTEWLQHFAELNGYSLEDAERYYHVRDILNIRLFLNIQAAMKKRYAEHFNYEQGGNILFAGTPSGASTNRSRLCRLLYDVGSPQIHWLCTPIYKTHLVNCLTLTRAAKNGEDLRLYWNDDQVKKRVRNNINNKNLNKPKIVRRPLKPQPKKFQVTVQISVDVKALNSIAAQQTVIDTFKEMKFNPMHIHTIYVPEVQKEQPKPVTNNSFDSYL